METDITRTVAIEHKGEKIMLEVHIHLNEDEIRRLLLPLVSQAFVSELNRRSPNYLQISSRSTMTM